ncbi:MAG: helix-turn-helix transcriptional regulator [Candidatus Omnitrophota bacterium]|nr:MAG: helix-turn-helix transcriptional regulator [Candidatus Omnitrophota bacterium]
MTTIDKQKFSRAIKRYREERDLTQQELARKLVVTVTTIARWELGMAVPKQERTIKEIKALGITW